jgi:hypothetical protein
MIQLILKGVTMFCGAGGQIWAPFVMQLVNPFSWSVLVLCVFLPIYFSNPSVLNSADGKKKQIDRTFGIAFGIYYVIMVIILCSVMQSACKVNDSYNPM